MNTVRVLIVDDSALVRHTLTRLLDHEGFDVVGTASNGVEAIAAADELDPDVVSLDLDMPVMDGMTCLSHLVQRRRQPAVILSTLAQADSFATFKALALGAVDFVTKPGAGLYISGLDELGAELRSKLRAAARVPREHIGSRRPRPRDEHPRPPAQLLAFDGGVRGIIGLGGSTGGTLALEEIVATAPPDLPVAIVAVLHLPRGFARPLAGYLATRTPLRVKEADDDELLARRTIYICPGGAHARLQRRAGAAYLRLDSQAPAHNGYHPSIDLFLYSLAAVERHRAAAALLSGMGTDGVNGLLAVRQQGGVTLVQERASAVVAEMPACALRAGACEREARLDRLVPVLTAALNGPAILARVN